MTIYIYIYIYIPSSAVANETYYADIDTSPSDDMMTTTKDGPLLREEEDQ